MKQHLISEGYMPFLGYQTYYRIVGEPSNKPALLLLHGGPGSTHNYFEVLDRIADTGRQVISYDQIGCGNSYLDGHPELWTQETWINELIALREYLHLDQIHLLGQSWGAMQAIAYIIDCKPEGIKSVILSSGHASSSLWASEQHRLIQYMPEEDQEAIRRAEASGKWDDPDYLRANDHYYERYVISVDENSPECIRAPQWWPPRSTRTSRIAAGRSSKAPVTPALWNRPTSTARFWRNGWKRMTGQMFRRTIVFKCLMN